MGVDMDIDTTEKIPTQSTALLTQTKPFHLSPYFRDYLFVSVG